MDIVSTSLCSSSSISLHCTLYISPSSTHSLHYLPVLPTMPWERGKPKWGACKNNTLSCSNRLTPSQRVLIAHFASPHHSSKSTQLALLQSHEVCRVKLEMTSSTMNFPLSPPPPFLYLLSNVKEEAPPSGEHLPPTTNPLAPPIAKPSDPYYGDERCQVEEEIPQSLQLEIKVGTDKVITVKGDYKIGKEEEALPQHFSNRLIEEYLELLFEIRKR